MKFDPESLAELKQLCAEHLQRVISDSEAQDIGQRIVRFLLNSEPSLFSLDQGVDPGS